MKICAVCNTSFETYVMIDGQKKNLSQRKYCLVCSPYGQHNTRQLEPHLSASTRLEHYCSKCKIMQPAKNFYKRSEKGRRQTLAGTCKSCTIARGASNKQWAVDRHADKCDMCLNSFAYYQYDFHHPDSFAKESNFNSFHCASKEKIAAMTDSCLLLCRNCHREHHYNARTAPLSSYGEKARANKLKAIAHLGGSCEVCGYDACPGALDFHHQDPSTKQYELSKILHGGWKRIQHEIDKCQLLCGCCHMKHHHSS